MQLQDNQVKQRDELYLMYLRMYIIALVSIFLIPLMLNNLLSYFGINFLGIVAQDSISAYYHTEYNVFFVGILCIVGMLLFLYKGLEDTMEGILLSLAGFSLIGVVLFPVALQFVKKIIVVNFECVGDLKACPKTEMVDAYTVFTMSIAHYIFAMFFFGLIASVIFYYRVKLPKTKKYQEYVALRKYYRESPNYIRFFKWLSIVMALSVIFIPIKVLVLKGEDIFWEECVAIICFVLYWVAKRLQKKQYIDQSEVFKESRRLLFGNKNK